MIYGNKSKLILRKTFVVSKSAVIKKYGTVKEDFFKYTKKQFCKYFGEDYIKLGSKKAKSLYLLLIKWFSMLMSHG